MRVYLHKFAKRINSTAQPLVQDGTPVDVTFKDDTNVLTPELRLLWSGSGNPTEYNYLQAPDLLVGYMIGSTYSTSLRYYWIKSWTYSERQWVAQCELDVLATWRNAIANSTKYVTRAAAEWDPDILDSYYPAKGDPEEELLGLLTSQNFPIAYDGNGGSFVLGVSGLGNTYSVGGCGFVVVGISGLQAVLDACFNQGPTLWDMAQTSDIGTAFNEYGKRLQKSIQNPIQFINSCMWVPFTPNVGSSFQLRLGTYNTGVTVAPLADPLFTLQVQLTSPIRDEMLWPSVEPFTEYYLELPPFGTVQVPAELIEFNTTAAPTANSITIDLRVDCISGQAILRVSGKKHDIGGGIQIPMLAVLESAMMGVPIGLAGTTVDSMGALSSGLNAAASIGNAFAMPSVSSILGAFNSVGDAIKAHQPQAVGSGKGGGFSAYSARRIFYCIRRIPTTENVAEWGRPLCKERLLRDLPGFQMLADGHLSNIIATSTEHEALRQYLEGGYFFV